LEELPEKLGGGGILTGKEGGLLIGLVWAILSNELARDIEIKDKIVRVFRKFFMIYDQ
jgi:hypothetical protein